MSYKRLQEEQEETKELETVKFEKEGTDKQLAPDSPTKGNYHNQTLVAFGSNEGGKKGEEEGLGVELLDTKLLDEEDREDLPHSPDYDSEPERLVFIQEQLEDRTLVRKETKTYRFIRRALGVGAFVMLFAFLATAIVLIAISPKCSGPELPWWKTTVIYQCYPRSFQDSDGDGNGDLNGIRSRIDHFVDIGIKAVWLNPIFTSPQKDNGYDIANYTDIDPLFGTLEEFKALLRDLHDNGIHLLMDLVPNHTSDEHPWFLESASSITNAKRDWYIWADGKENGDPPNNWISVFGGSAWTYCNNTGQYYLHQFSEFQPDLNYRNPEVVRAIDKVIKFWLDMGVDGFRVDAIKFLLEDPELQDEPTNPDATTNDSSSYDFLIHNQTTDYPGIHNITRHWRSLLDSYSTSSSERFMVGEAYGPVETVMLYYGENNNEFNFPFNFFLLENTEWTGIAVSQTVNKWLDNMPNETWPNWVLGNHDNPRIASKAGVYLARALNVLLLTLPGTPTTYYGEEILMTNVYVPQNKSRDLYADRDEERTPMQWNVSRNAGFTSNSTPWLPVADNYTLYNVDTEMENNSTMLILYKTLVELRSNNVAFQYTNYECVVNSTDILAYHRYHDNNSDHFLVVVNFSQQPTTATFDVPFVDPQIVLSTNLNRTGAVNLNSVNLLQGEALVIRGRWDACA